MCRLLAVLIGLAGAGCAGRVAPAPEPLATATAGVKQVRHYVFFNRDRERIHDAQFLELRRFDGAQVKYTWRELEPEKDVYDFSAIRADLDFLSAHGKRLFVQLQDVTFDASIVNVPEYMRRDTRYNGGANQQYDGPNGEAGGWVARRWDPAVQERFYKLLDALGREFDGRIAGINLAETAVGYQKAERFPDGFTFEAYRDAVIANMRALKRAFPESVTIQYANFMPGEWLPDEDHGYLRAVYEAARQLKVGVGGPDLLPYRRGQLNHSYPLIHEASTTVPVGIAVQDGNYEHENPTTRTRVTLPELLEFATRYLNADFVFWCTQEPFYSRDVLPFIERGPH